MPKGIENLNTAVDIQSQVTDALKISWVERVIFPRTQQNSEHQDPHEENNEIRESLTPENYQKLRFKALNDQLSVQEYKQLFEYTQEHSENPLDLKIQEFTPEIKSMLSEYEHSNIIRVCKVDFSSRDLSNIKDFPDLSFETKVPEPIFDIQDVQKLSNLGNNLRIYTAVTGIIDEETAKAIVKNKNIIIDNSPRKTNMPLKIINIFREGWVPFSGLKCPELEQKNQQRIKSIIQDQINAKIATNRNVDWTKERGNTDNISIENLGQTIKINTFWAENTEYHWWAWWYIATTVNGERYKLLEQSHSAPFERSNIRHLDGEFFGVAETTENANKLKAIFEIGNTYNRFLKNFVQNPEHNGKEVVFKDGKIQLEKSSRLDYGFKDIWKAFAESTGIYESQGFFSKDAIKNLNTVCQQVWITFNPQEFCEMLNRIKQNFEK